MSIAFASFASSVGFAFGVRVKYVISGFIAGDLYWANVTLLLTGDTIDDSSNIPKTVIRNGTIVNKTVKKYGSGSYQFPTPTGMLISYPGLIGPNDYTVEFWFKAGPSTDIFPTLFTFISPTGFGLACTRTGIYGSKTGDITSGPTTGYSIWGYCGDQISAAYDSGSWHHIAVVKCSVNLYVFIDGIIAGIPITNMSNCNETGLQIGYGIGSGFTGYIDDFRITSGVARYTTDFSVATKSAPYLLRAAPFERHMIAGDALIAFDNTANIFDWVGS